jgi:3-oxoacyl-[acyl-carrier-protein] synthase-1
MTEAAIALLSLEQNFTPGSPTTRAVAPEIQCQVVLRGQAGPLSRVMSNSFGFGGSNCTLIFVRDG